ncbi:unnamed protein product, partial [Urochloa humidicola]
VLLELCVIDKVDCTPFVENSLNDTEASSESMYRHARSASKAFPS